MYKQLQNPTCKIAGQGHVATHNYTTLHTRPCEADYWPGYLRWC